MRYRLRFQVERELAPGEGRIAEPDTWGGVQARTIVVELPDSLAGDALDAALERVANERQITRWPKP